MATITSQGKRVAGGTGLLILVIVGALIIGLGVPALWFWVGSKLGGNSTPGEYTSPQTFAAILPGMLITYLLVLDFAGWLYNRTISEEQAREQRWPVRRAAWNRSMRDQRYRPGESKLSLVEVTFVLTATAASVAISIWFFFFAGSPL